jgi:hypothetical protein
MKTLVFYLGLIASAGCSPIAEEFCEAQVGCGFETSVDGCLSGLRYDRNDAETNGCVDQYYAFVDCQVNVEFACTDDFAGLLTESCSAEWCEYDGCRKSGAAQWERLTEDRCNGDRLDPVGTWSLQSTPVNLPPAEPCSNVVLSHEIKVTKSGGTFKLMLTSAGVLMTGAIEASHDSAQMTARIQDGSSAVYINVTAMRSSMPNATISGGGSRNLNDCADYLNTTGQLRR